MFVIHKKTNVFTRTKKKLTPIYSSLQVAHLGYVTCTCVICAMSPSDGRPSGLMKSMS